MKLYEAQHLAEYCRAELAPYCEPGRCVIAGSTRREREEVRDLELVCIPRLVPVLRHSVDFFTPPATDYVRDPEFVRAVERWEKIKGDAATGKYTQRRIRHCPPTEVHSGIETPPSPVSVEVQHVNLDLFMCTCENWGAILLIRTGDWEYSKWFMGSALRRAGYEMRDGYVWRKDTRIAVSEESDMFTLAGIDYCEPFLRHR